MTIQTLLNSVLTWLRGLSRPKLIILGVSAAALVIILIAWAGSSTTREGAQNVPLFEVVRGPLTISVSEPGTIKSREQEVVKNEVEGHTTILWLIPEGTAVKAGDLLMELDAATLIEERTRQQLTVLNAEAAYVRAREELAVTESQAASDIEKAELASKFAGIDLRKYVEGEYPQLVEKANAEITLAKEELERAKNDKLKWSVRLFAEEYITRSELLADQLAAQRAELNLQLAEVELKVLKDFTYQRQLEQLNSDVKQTAASLERAKLKANADLTQARSELASKQTERDRQKAQLEKIEYQIGKCKLYAPVSGTVVYATTGQPPWRGRGPLEEGRELREREELIYLPTASSMKAEVKVHEASMPKIRQGLPVRLTIDAVPGKSFTGRVEKIGFIPDAQSSWMNPDLKLYNTEVYVDGDGSELRPGMTCQAEIIFDQYPDVMYVPISAIVRVNNQPMVYVRDGDDYVRKPVDIGLDNNRMVVINSGLSVKQKVMMAPPLPDTSAEQEPLMQVAASQPATPVVPVAAVTPALGATSQPGAAATSQPGAAAGAPGQPTSQPAATPEELAAAQAVLKEAGLSPEDMATMTPEQRRSKFESLTPEQQAALRKVMPRRSRNGQGGQRGAGAVPGMGGAGAGAPGAGAPGAGAPGAGGGRRGGRSGE